MRAPGTRRRTAQRPHIENAQKVNEARLRDIIESRTIKVAEEEFQLRLVGLSETANHAVLLAIAVGGTDERLQLQLSEELWSDPIALRQRVVYSAKRMVITAGLPKASSRSI